MLNLVKTSDPKTVEDYHTLASKLNEDKNYVVKKCTMEGPSHDNLHVFLHPLIEKIEALGEVSTTDEGAKITRSEEHTSELQSRENLVCRLLLEKKNKTQDNI